MLVLLSCTLMATAPIMMVGGVIMALREDVGLSWLLVVSVPALLVSVSVVISQMLPSYRVMQVRIDAVNKTLREQITGIRVVRAFVREPFETCRFDTANRELTDVALRVGRWMAVMFPLVFLILNVSSVAVLWFGAQRVDVRHRQACPFQRHDHTRLTVNRVRAFQQLPRRLAPQDIGMARRNQLVGGIGLPTLELVNLHRPGKARYIGLQPALKRRLVKGKALAHGGGAAVLLIVAAHCWT